MDACGFQTSSVEENSNVDKSVTTCEASCCREQLSGVPSKCSRCNLSLKVLPAEEAEEEGSTSCGDEYDDKFDRDEQSSKLSQAYFGREEESEKLSDLKDVVEK